MASCLALGQNIEIFKKQMVEQDGEKKCSTLVKKN